MSMASDPGQHVNWSRAHISNLKSPDGFHTAKGKVQTMANGHIYKDCKYHQLTIAVPSVKNNVIFVIPFFSCIK